jgi:peroxiredoxin
LFTHRRNDSFIILLGWLVFASITALAGCKEMPAARSGDPAPTIACNDITGEYVSLSQLKGSVVVLFFWSSKCCGDSLKQLEPFYLQHKYNGLTLIGIEVGGAKDAVASFVKQSGLTFSNITDENESFAQSYRVVGFPTIFVIDKNGIILKKVSGEVQAGQLNALVAPYL